MKQKAQTKHIQVTKQIQIVICETKSKSWDYINENNLLFIHYPITLSKIDMYVLFRDIVFSILIFFFK